MINYPQLLPLCHLLLLRKKIQLGFFLISEVLKFFFVLLVVLHDDTFGVYFVGLLYLIQSTDSVYEVFADLLLGLFILVELSLLFLDGELIYLRVWLLVTMSS